MKKLLLATAIAAVSSTSAMAADSADIQMGATISERCIVDLVSTNPNVLFSLDQTVANIDLICNTQGAIDVKIESANAGNLVNGSDNVPYTIDVDPLNVATTNISFVFDNFSIATPIVGTFASGTLLGGVQVDLRVNVNQGNNSGTGLFAGNYTDTMTVSIGPSGTL